MKLVAIALLLGGTATVCDFAVRSKIRPPEPAAATTPVISPISKAEALSLIDQAARKYRVPAPFVASIVQAESNFNCAAVSSRGAVGLMQLMPETAQQYGVNPAVPAENIDGGTRYLHWLMARYRKSRNAIKRVIAAYNAGPGMVDHYRGIPPFRETRTYVTRVMGFMKRFTPSRKHPDMWASGIRSAVAEVVTPTE